MAYTINTPEGTRDRLFAECRERRQVQRDLTALFQRRGYAEVSTPEVEFYDLFLQSGNPMPQESMLKIIDRSGKIMVMRPDCTTPIARVAATKLKALPLPQRLFYDQTVFRSGQAHRGGSSEIRRGRKYDAIIMDPPSYGRGPSGETWKIEEDVADFVELTMGVLSDKPLFVLISSYSTGLAPSVMAYLLGITAGRRAAGHIEAQELGLPVESTGLVLPCGSSARFIAEE